MTAPPPLFAARWKRLAAAIMCIGLIAPAAAESLSGAALVEALRQGGYVLTMRHPSSPAAVPDKASADPANTSLERQLDETGRSTARAMGEALRALRIPIGQVLSSPTFRALQAVQLLGVGDARKVAELGEGEHGMMANADVARSEWLRKQVAEPPRPGTNTLIITHTPNLSGAFGDSAKATAAGEALIFRPNGKGQAVLLSRIRIEEWQKLRDATKAH